MQNKGLNTATTYFVESFYALNALAYDGAMQ